MLNFANRFRYDTLSSLNPVMDEDINHVDPNHYSEESNRSHQNAKGENSVGSTDYAPV